MVAQTLISQEIKPLTLDATGQEAFRRQTKYHVKHLPVVSEEGKLLGIISEEDIFNHKVHDPIGQYDYALMRKSSVQMGDHLFEVMRIMGDLNLTLIPVTDMEGNYQGVITLKRVMDHLSSTSAIVEEGGIIVLEMARRDYSLTEIARIIEAEDTKIMSASITSPQAEEMIELTIKINRPEVFRVVSGLERHGYTVKETHVEEEYQGVMQDRYDGLMRYLDV
jgi:acetoin utilization protein AcuB